MPNVPRSLPIALAFAGATILTWARFAITGSLAVDAKSISLVTRYGFLVAFGVLAAVAAYSWYRAFSRSRGGVTRELLVGAIAIHLLAAPALPLTSNDLHSNLAYGRMAAIGLDPNRQGPAALGDDHYAALVGGRWISTPTVYGPVVTNLARAAASVDNIAASIALFKLEMLACTFAVIALAWRYTRRRADDGARRFILLAWNPLLAWETSAQAHNDALVVLALVAFVVALDEDRPIAAAVSLALGLLSKFMVAPVAGLWLVARARKSPLRAAGLAALIALVAVLLYAPVWHGLDTLSGLRAAATGGAEKTAHSFIDLAVIAARLVGDAPAATLYRVLSTLVNVLLGGLAVRAAWRTRDAASALRESFLFLLAYCLLTPWFQPWYALWLLPLALAISDEDLVQVAAVFTALQLVAYGLPIDPVTNIAINSAVFVYLFRRRRSRIRAHAAA